MQRAERESMVEGELFLLHPSSQAFLDGDRRGIRARFRFRHDALDYLAMAAIVVGGLVLLIGLSRLTAWLATEGTETTVSAFVVAAVLIGIGAFFINSRHRWAAAHARLIDEGQVLPGTVVGSSGREETTSEVSLGEVPRSYLVTVEYRFSAPAGHEIADHAEHNRPDLRRRELPEAGTAVRVLYLDEQVYALL
jgi:hypothetical protein